MFENEAYKYLSTGQLEQIPHITAETLYHTYQSMINNDQCSVYVVGNVEPESVENQIREKFALKPFDKHQFNILLIIYTMKKLIILLNMMTWIKLN